MMDLKATMLAALTSAAWLAAPAALSQEPPSDAHTTHPADPQAAGEELDEATPPAQDPSGRAVAPGGESAVTIDDQKLEQFADAYVEVQSIQQKAMSDLQSTTDPAQADKVKMDAESNMIAAVERNGLKVDEFNQIVQTMASNADIRNRVAAKLQKRSGG